MCYPAVSRCTRPKARDCHQCVECDSTINVGEKYELVEGLWDGEWQRFKTCKTCSSVRQELDKRGIEVFFGELIETLIDADLIVRVEPDSESYESLEDWLIVSNNPLRVRLSNAVNDALDLYLN